MRKWSCLRDQTRTFEKKAVNLIYLQLNTGFKQTFIQNASCPCPFYSAVLATGCFIAASAASIFITALTCPLSQQFTLRPPHSGELTLEGAITPRCSASPNSACISLESGTVTVEQQKTARTPNRLPKETHKEFEYVFKVSIRGLGSWYSLFVFFQYEQL